MSILYQATLMLTHEEWVNGARYKSLFGAPPPANPVRNTRRLNDWKSLSFGRLVIILSDGVLLQRNAQYHARRERTADSGEGSRFAFK